MDSLPSFFRHARKKALESDQDHRHGAVVVKSGRVLSVGKNELNKTNWLTKKFFNNYPTIHAECNALAKLSLDNIRGSTVYVYREKWTSVPGLSKPCERCMIALRSLGVRKVCYTTDEAPFFDFWYPAA